MNVMKKVMTLLLVLSLVAGGVVAGQVLPAWPPLVRAVRSLGIEVASERTRVPPEVTEDPLLLAAFTDLRLRALAEAREGVAARVAACDGEMAVLRRWGEDEDAAGVRRVLNRRRELVDELERLDSECRLLVRVSRDLRAAEPLEVAGALARRPAWLERARVLGKVIAERSP